MQRWRVATALAVANGAMIATAGSSTAQEAAYEFEAPIRLEADGVPIDTAGDIGYAGPMLRDMDGDGLDDLLVSAFRGNIRVFRNVGTASAPEYKEVEPLQADGQPLKFHNW